MFSQVGPLELILVLVIVLVIFGPKRLPSLGRQLGRGMREFKDSLTGDGKAHHQDGDEGDEAEARPALPPARDADEGPAAERAPTESASEHRG